MALGVSRAIICMRFIVGLSSLLLLGGWRLDLRRRRCPGRNRHPQAGEGRRRVHALEVAINAPGARLKICRSRSSRTANTALVAWPSQAAHRSADRRQRVSRDIGKQAVPASVRRANIVVTARAASSTDPTVGRRASRCPRSGSSGRACRSSPRTTTSITAARRWSCIASRPGRDVRRAGRRRRVSGFSGRERDRFEGVKIATRRAGRVLRAAHDQDLNTPMRLFARDEAGNTARADFDIRCSRSRSRTQPHRARRQVPRPRRAGHPRRTTESSRRATTARQVPGDQRRAAAEEQREDRRSQRRPRRSCCGAARCSIRSRTPRSSPRSPTHRTYVYQGRKSTSRCTSASTSRRSPARRSWQPTGQGAVRRRARHLRQLRHPRSRHGRAVALRAPVVDRGQGRRDGREGQPLGRSGMTGLAGGDHLHFTMLVNGQTVNPVEWWDSHWIEDRILRKLRGWVRTRASVLGQVAHEASAKFMGSVQVQVCVKASRGGRRGCRAVDGGELAASVASKARARRRVGGRAWTPQGRHVSGRVDDRRGGGSEGSR